MRGRIVAGVGTVGVGVALWAVPCTPMREWPILSSLVAVDAVMATLGIVLAIVVALFSVRHGRRGWLILAVASGLVGVLFGARCLTQGLSDGSAPVPGDGIAFVSWNAGDADAGTIAEQLIPRIERADAAVVVLPETGWLAGASVAEELARRGFANVAFAPESSTTTVVLSASLAKSGGYSLDDSAPPWAGTVVRPENAAAATPVIVGVHVQQPAVASVDTWKMHLGWIRAMCAEERYIGVIGDFNSTVNSLGSAGVGTCADVASAHGAGAAATWPTLLPPLFGIAIDRFMLGDGYRAPDATYLVDRSVRGSDHWAIVGTIPCGGRGS